MKKDRNNTLLVFHDTIVHQSTTAGAACSRSVMLVIRYQSLQDGLHDPPRDQHGSKGPHRRDHHGNQGGSCFISRHQGGQVEQHAGVDLQHATVHHGQAMHLHGHVQVPHDGPLGVLMLD